MVLWNRLQWAAVASVLCLVACGCNSRGPSEPLGYGGAGGNGGGGGNGQQGPGGGPGAPGGHGDGPGGGGGGEAPGAPINVPVVNGPPLDQREPNEFRDALLQALEPECRQHGWGTGCVRVVIRKADLGATTACAIDHLEPGVGSPVFRGSTIYIVTGSAPCDTPGDSGGQSPGGGQISPEVSPPDSPTPSPATGNGQ